MSQQSATKQSLAQRLEFIDRRVIFLIMAVAVIVPLLSPLGLVVDASRSVNDFYHAVESLPEGATVLVADDWDPGSIAELKTASIVVHEHLFQRGLKVINLTLWEGGTGIVDRTLTEVAERYDLTYGEDYVWLGFKPGREQAMLPMAENLHNFFPTDAHGTRLSNLPVTANVAGLKDVAMVFSVSAGYPGTKEWVQQIAGRFDAPMVSICGGVSAPEYYTYYDAGQLVGLVGGLQQMAEFEKLVDRPAFATRAMDAQSVGHYTLVVLIIIGNVLYLINKRQEAQA
jgi:hypothetical protein